MKRIIFLLILFLLISTAADSGNLINYGGVFYKEGALTKPDSLRVNMTFIPSNTDTTFLSEPDSAVWDTTVNLTNKDDLMASIDYVLWFGTSQYHANELVEMRFDSSKYTEETYQKFADSIRQELERPRGFLWAVTTFWGAQDSTRMLYYPLDGSTPKDSVQIVDSAGTLLMSILYQASNVAGVMDSTIIIHRVSP